jgi:NDP-sugar pyrophosphorylase family protein
MHHPTIVILAAGLSTRYGGSKQVDGIGPDGEALLDYTVYDALASGFGAVVLIVSESNESQLVRRFRDRFGTGIPMRTVVQELHRLPPGFSVPPDRRKPWGTGHAVLCLDGNVEGPFAVANADDFYGRSAYRALVDHFRTSDRAGEACVVGYPVATTLSEHGGVSRAVCETDAEGRLVRIGELLELRRSVDGRIVGRTAGGSERALEGTEPVSMNLWGLTHELLPVLWARFGRFLESRSEDAGAEFYLSDAVGDLVRDGDAVVRVPMAEDKWFGMTFPQDRPLVRERIGQLVRAGEYPRSLREAVKVADPRVPGG